MTASGRATRFLAEIFNNRAPLSMPCCCGIADYLEPALVKQMVANLTELLRPGGVILAMFHSKKPEGFKAIAVADSNTLQVISTAIICPAQKVYQKPRDSGPFWPLSDDEIVCRRGPTTRDSLHPSQPWEISHPSSVWKLSFTLSSLHSTNRRSTKRNRELTAPRDHTHRGLECTKTEPHPLLRCVVARETYVC